MLLKLDTSTIDGIFEAVAELDADSDELRRIQALFSSNGDPETMAELTTEMLGIDPDDAIGYVLRRSSEVGRERWRQAGETLVGVLERANVQLEPFHRALLELRLTQLRCEACGYTEEVLDDPRGLPDSCVKCWASISAKR